MKRSSSGGLAGLLPRFARVLEHVLLEAFHPFEVAHRPHVGEAHGEDGDEDEDLEEGQHPLAFLDEGPIDRRNRIHEGDLDLEDHEHEGDEIEARVEVVPGLPDRLLAALVDHLLLRGRVVRPQEMTADQRSEDEQDRDRGEDQDVGEMEGHVSPLLCNGSGRAPESTGGGVQVKPCNRPQGGLHPPGSARLFRATDRPAGATIRHASGIRAGGRLVPRPCRSHRPVLSFHPVAILQALISLITKSAGKILNAAFGWAVLALFGRTTPKEQTLLSAVVAAAAAWPLLVVGIAFPKAMLFVVSFVPLSKSVPSLALRIVWIALALFVPLIVGSMIAARAPKDALPESSLKRLLRGFQVTFALAVAFVLMLVLAPGMKIVNALKGRKDVRLPALVQEGAGGEFMSAFVAALALHHIELRPGDPPWHMTAPASLLKKLGGRAFANFGGERPEYRVAAELEVNLNPNELLLRGKERALLRGQSVAQEVMAPRCILATMDARAQDLERQIKRVWQIYAERPGDHRISAALIARRDEIASDLSKSDVPYDEV